MDLLHVRCGSDIREGLALAGLGGDFLEVSDPLCQGPVPRGDDLAATRAAFIAEAYGVPRAEAAARLQAEADGLAAAGARRQVVLWFEHDSYDQLILARVLAHFAQAGRPAELALICIDRFPGLDRFIGLGQLGPEQLRSFWPERQPVSSEQLALGTAVWEALREPDPLPLWRLAEGGTPALPVMAPALHRHLQELPWVGDGLGLTERLTLQAIAEGASTVGQVFARLYGETEPLPFLGDLMFWAIVGTLATAPQPPLALGPEGEGGWAGRSLALTPVGEELLAGGLDWMALAPPVRWVGGVRLDAAGPAWRWNPDGAPLPARRA